MKNDIDVDIGKIFVDYNKGWGKRNKGKLANQRLVQIPHSLMMKKVKSTCERYDIQFT